MNTHEHIKKIYQHLEDEIRQVEILKNALDQEKDILNQGNAKEIEQSSANKIQVLKIIEASEQQRIQILSALNLNPIDSAMDQYIKAFDSQGNIQKKWHTLLEIMEQCRISNEANHMIIEINQQRTQRTLNILQGNNNNQQNTYESSGKKSNYTTRQTIATA
ncbi:MAG: flagellar protein FlgN [Gammaproteobacteria bacterium]|nr:flagellar protein FlgN [Gammaproteobacteria bacterium]